MMDLSISQMMQMQLDLYEPHKEKWFPMEPEFGKDFVLFMVEEIGETIAILKKKGSQAIMNDADVRRAFLAEMADVLMYYHDILLCFTHLNLVIQPWLEAGKLGNIVSTWVAM